MTTAKKAEGFKALGLNASLLAALDALGYEEPTPIQRDAIPALLAGRDLLGQAATGTGKTAAFALPLLQRVLAHPRRATAPALLVLVPTRELAMQVAEALHRYGRGLGARVLPVYGGQSLGQQFRALGRGVDAVVATPGRALDHIRRGTLALDEVQAVVLDEADEMLDMGFSEDLEAILSAVPEARQTALFSATIPARISSIADRHLRTPVRVVIPDERLTQGEAPLVRQAAYLVSRAHKTDALGRILDHEGPASALVFCRTRNEVDELAQSLSAHGYRAEALHGGLSQRDRDRVMRRFREGTAELLLATDVAARGLDIGRVSHVINFDVPSDPDSYVHRIGRTGRAGREGVAITLVEPREKSLLRNIEKSTGRRLELKTVPTFADLRARQMEATLQAVRTAVAKGGYERFRGLVETLAGELDPLDIAAAAVKMAHAGKEYPETDPITSAPPPRERPAAAGRPPRGERPPRDKKPARKPRPDVPFSKVYISIGSTAGVRPGDLVGAITNEAGLEGSDLGPIEIGERHALVDVRDDRLDDVVEALRRTTIRGKKVTASRYRLPRSKGGR